MNFLLYVMFQNPKMFPTVKVLAPVSFRDTIHADAKAMLARYE